MRLIRSVLISCFACLACSSTVSKQSSKPCADFDGCLTVPIENTDFAPFVPGTEPDGKGTLYVGLIDQCPTPTTPTFKVVSQVATITGADLTKSVAYTASVSYFFADPTLDTNYAEGDTVYLGGIFDDVEDASADAPIPGPNDSVLGCVSFKLARGHTQEVLALGPCLLLEAAGPPYVFHQNPLTNAGCGSVVPPDAGAGGAGQGGNSAGGAAGAAGSGVAGAP
jgi:hypothetical protein